MSYLQKFLSQATKQSAIDSCADIIRPKMFKMVLPTAAALQESMPDVLQGKWSKWLKDVEKNSFILETIIKAMFKNDNSNIAELSSLSLSSVTPAKVTMIFGGFEKKTEQKKFARLVATCLGEGFEVVTINGDETSNREAQELVKGKVNAARRQGKRVVLVSKDMASRSFSIPQIDTVFLMYDNGSLAQTQQKVSRAFTPGETYAGGKKIEGVVVSLSLDANRRELDPIDLYVIAEATRISDGEESMQDSIKRICNSVNLFQNDLALGSVPVEADDYANSLLQQSSIFKSILGQWDASTLDLQAYYDGLLFEQSSNLNVHDSSKVEVNIEAVRTTLEVPTEEAEQEEVEPMDANERKQFLENVIFLMSNITVLVDFSNYEYSNIKDIVTNLTEASVRQEVEQYYGIKFECIKDLILTDKLPTRLLNTVIDLYLKEV